MPLNYLFSGTFWAWNSISRERQPLPGTKILPIKGCVGGVLGSCSRRCLCGIWFLLSVLHRWRRLWHKTSLTLECPWLESGEDLRQRWVFTLFLAAREETQSLFWARWGPIRGADRVTAEDGNVDNNGGSQEALAVARYPESFTVWILSASLWVRCIITPFYRWGANGVVKWLVQGCTPAIKSWWSE